jgi:dTDP-4-dehydrorhamnose reductase
VVRAIAEFTSRGITGLYNLGGPRAMSRLELVELLAQHLFTHTPIRPQIVPCSIRDFDFLEPRPLDTSLDSGKAFALLSFAFRTMEELCKNIASALSGAQG